MATAYYSQSAGANYFKTGPSSKRGYRACDQCGASETSAVKFRQCGACMTVQYCSPVCQKLHWPSHRSICQHTVSQMSNAKQLGASSIYGDENIANYLRKFTSSYLELLGWTVFQALCLKRVPSNVRQQALLIDLDYSENPDPRRRFTVKGTHIVPRTYVSDPQVTEDIRRREVRCRQNGGIGCAVILLQCGAISQVVPFEVDRPSTISWGSEENWAEVLVRFVESGRTDFMSFSAPPRGGYYT